MNLQSVIDEARARFLADAKKVRWTDARLLEEFRNALREAYGQRPDLFYSMRIGTDKFSRPAWEAGGASELTLSGAWPIGEQWVPIFQEYVAAVCESGGNEAQVAARATAFYNNFKRNLAASA